ncbi:hypothetical protein SAFG77S_04622 [Streptomyces afghaniensis]
MPYTARSWPWTGCCAVPSACRPSLPRTFADALSPARHTAATRSRPRSWSANSRVACAASEAYPCPQNTRPSRQLIVTWPATSAGVPATDSPTAPANSPDPRSSTASIPKPSSSHSSSHASMSLGRLFQRARPAVADAPHHHRIRLDLGQGTRSSSSHRRRRRRGVRISVIVPSCRHGGGSANRGRGTTPPSRSRRR